jgi:RNA polymerase sigma-70 factor (ECF subfamily)
MAPAAILDLLKRVQGEGTIPKEVLAKLKKGESLTYPEAHEIATLAENARVRTLYGVDPKVYQEALKPYIKQVAEDNKSQPASNIPESLDTKPYEDMDHLEVLKGQGETPEERKSLAAGIGFDTKRPRGRIGKKALGVAGVAAGGAALGAALSPEDKDKGALVGAALPLLGRIIHEEDLPETRRLPNEMSHVQAAIAGDQRAITTLYNHYMPRFIKSMDRYMRAAGPRLGLSGEDIAQQAFLKAIQNLPNFKGNSSFSTWLHAIGKNEALNAITESSREVPTESMFRPTPGDTGGAPSGLTGHVGFGGDTAELGSEPVKPSVQGAASTEETPESLNAGRQISQLVRQTIATMPKQYAEVLRLFELEGMTALEVARTLQRPVNTVLSQAARGREYLAKVFQGTETEKLFKQQGGFADPELLKRLAKFAVLAGGGAALGANLFDPQSPYKSMAQGAVLGLMAGQVKWGNLFKQFKNSMHNTPVVDIRDILNQYDWNIARAERLTAQTRYAIDGLVKTEAERIALAQGVAGANPQATQILRAVTKQMDQQTLRDGTVREFLQHYLYNAWKDTPERDKALAAIRAAFKKQSGKAPLTQSQQFNLIRKYTGLSSGKAEGLVPVSEDASVLVGHYIDSATRAMVNKNLVDSLKSTPLPTGKGRLVRAAGMAPSSYVSVDASPLKRYKVHPSIAPSLDFLHQASGGNAGVLALEALNTAVKRVQVNLSLFHAKALLDAFAGAGEITHPWRNFVDAALSFVGKNRGHEQYLEGHVGDDVDHLIRSLKITPRRGNVPVEDVTSGFYDGLKVLQNALDETIPGAGKQTVGRVTQLSKALDHLLWENVHSGLKLVVGMNALERLRRSYARDVMKNPNAHVPTLPELADRAANYTNDIFGGLNWRRIADDARTQWGSGLGHALTNPEARRVAQIMMFAPDWTYSTVRSMVKAVGKGSGPMGLLRPKEVADLHRLYILRSALIYFTLYNGINMALSGHPIYENKRNGKPEPFMVDMGNGEWAQANKHAMEVPNLIMDPKKWILGKLGNIPSEVLEQLTNKEYLNPDYSPPMKESGMAHAAKRFLPFSVESYLNQGPKEAVMSALGVPVYGRVKGGEQEVIRKQKAQEERKEHKANKEQQKLNALMGES